jgi:hypothetical protein
MKRDAARPAPETGYDEPLNALNRKRLKMCA